ncbi:MAG: efflux RND transporter periplasmic adaptor subunit [Gemmatimonadales bacterium]
MPTPETLLRRLVRLAPLVLLATAACSKPAAEAAAPQPPVQVPADQVAIVDSLEVESGPALSGTLTAERTAQVRSQMSGTVLALYVKEGQAVSAGQALALIDTTVAAEQARSARSALRSAQVQSQLATRNAERSAALLKAGAIADRDEEGARAQAQAAAAAVADATSRLASAEKLLRDGTVRAPFAGVISELPVSAGDVVQGGAGGATLLATVVDPSELTLEASVPAENLNGIKRGAKVEFTLNGMSKQVVTGTVARINPTVDATTRQVRIYVVVPNRNQALASGLFAEGRVTIEAARALAVPISALDPRATTPSVKRLKGGKVESVPVTVGLRDALRERVVVTGVVRGDTVLLGGALGTPTGSSVRITRADG